MALTVRLLWYYAAIQEVQQRKPTEIHPFLFRVKFFPSFSLTSLSVTQSLRRVSVIVYWISPGFGPTVEQKNSINNKHIRYIIISPPPKQSHTLCIPLSLRFHCFPPSSLRRLQSKPNWLMQLRTHYIFPHEYYPSCVNTEAYGWLLSSSCVSLNSLWDSEFTTG